MVPGIITFQWCWALPLVNLLASDSTHGYNFAANTGAFQTAHSWVYLPVLVYRCFGFFTLLAKLPNYVPLMPAAAILVALLWSEIKVKASSPPAKETGKSWFLLQLRSGWLNVVFLLAGGSLFCIPYLLGDDNYTQPALLCSTIRFTSFGGVIWAITAVAGAITAPALALAIEC